MRPEIIEDAKRFKQSREFAARMLILQQERAKAYAKQFGVIVYVYSTPRGLAMDTTRPQVQEAWRVAPSGNITFVGSGS